MQTAFDSPCPGSKQNRDVQTAVCEKEFLRRHRARFSSLSDAFELNLHAKKIGISRR